MGKVLCLLAGGAILLAAGGASAAGNAEAGRAKAISCQVCHGPDGNSSNPLYPRLNGQHAKYTLKQLEAYKSGARKDPVMNELLQSMNRQDMEDIAAFFESVK